MGTASGGCLLLISCPAVDRHRWATGVCAAELRRTVDHRIFAQTMRAIGGASLDDHMSESSMHHSPSRALRALPGRRVRSGECASPSALRQSHGHRGELSEPRLLDMFPQTGRVVFSARRSDNAQVMACRCVDLAGVRHCCCRRVAFDRSSHELYCATNFLTTHGEQSHAFAIVRITSAAVVRAQVTACARAICRIPPDRVSGERGCGGAGFRGERCLVGRRPAAVRRRVAIRPMSICYRSPS